MKDYTREIISGINKKDDGYLLGKLRNANRNIFYTLLRSNVVNGLSVDSVIEEGMSWWQYAVIAIDVAIGVLAAGCTVLYVLNRFVFARKKEGEKNDSQFSEN